jgi:hypothetical protein
MHPILMKFMYHFKMDMLVGESTLNLRLKTRCTIKTLFYEIPARTSRVAVK